jgi:hypothetical protein
MSLHYILRDLRIRSASSFKVIAVVSLENTVKSKHVKFSKLSPISQPITNGWKNYMLNEYCTNVKRLSSRLLIAIIYHISVLAIACHDE